MTNIPINPAVLVQEAEITSGRDMNNWRIKTKFVLVINLKTGKALRLTIPPDMFALADQVIE